MPRDRPAWERMARALCSSDGHLENIRFEGRPMWESYLPQVRLALLALKDPAPTAGDDWTARIDAMLTELDMFRKA